MTAGQAGPVAAAATAHEAEGQTGNARAPAPPDAASAAAGIVHPWPAAPPEGEAAEVAPGILWMRLPLPMRLDHVNCYALREPDGWTVVDTGFDTPAARAVWQRLLDGPLEGAPVRRVLVTHHHPDHIGLAGWFMQQGAVLLTSRTAWLMARMLQLDVQKRPTPQQVGFWRSAGMDAAQLARRSAERPVNSADVTHPLPLGYARVQEGQVLHLGRRDWHVAIGHGHAPEHLVLFSAQGDLVIGGDQLLPGISPNLGVHATEPGANPVQDWVDSCARLMPLATAGQLVLPGHKLPYRGLPERLGQLAENHESALARLAASLADRPRTAADCFDMLFRRPIGEGEYGLALAEAVAHVNALAARGMIHRIGETPEGGAIWGARAAPAGRDSGAHFG